jgi:glycosyltransferase involved in cell wall biosynthesis
VLIVSPVRNAPSETFIKAQIEGLPTRVEVLFGGLQYLEDENGIRLTPRWARVLRRALEAARPQWSSRVDAYWFDRFLSRRRVRVVLAEYGPTGASLLVTCKRRSLPLVTQFLGFDASDRTVVNSLRADYGRLLGEEAATVAVSRDIERRLYTLGARLGSVHLVPCGVDVDRFHGASPEHNPPVFVAAGRFVEKKAPHLTLLAFSRVLADVPAARLQMVGGGPLLDACEQLANALGVAGSVEFLGFRSHEELAALMRGARAFVQHSMTAPSGDSEGMPVAILEAGASGLPVVATRHGGIPEAVVDGETGFLVGEGDVGAMADRMRQLALDPALAGRLGVRARAHVREHFRQSDTLGQLWGVLQLAMSSDRHRTAGEEGRV